MRETIELEVECHNGDLSQFEPITSNLMTSNSVAMTPPMTTTPTSTTTTTIATNVVPSQQHTQSIQQQQQPILQQPQLKQHSAPKLTNLPTLSISGPHYETDEVL